MHLKERRNKGVVVSVVSRFVAICLFLEDLKIICTNCQLYALNSNDRELREDIIVCA
jgi:hypothetical protein